jgi:hypothetical protein
MKKVRALLVILLGTAAVATAAPAASSATTLPVVFTCTQTPKACFGAGVLGPISALYFSSPSETVGALCINSFFHRCGLLDAVLVVEPGLVGVAADSEFLHIGVLGELIATRKVTFTLLSVGLLGSSYTLGVKTSDGRTGVIVVVPHVRKCLVINGTTISAVRC